MLGERELPEGAAQPLALVRDLGVLEAMGFLAWHQHEEPQKARGSSSTTSSELPVRDTL